MKKKFLYSVLISLCILGSALGLAACGETTPPNPDDGSHRHAFEKDYSSDETYHWHKATCGHTDAETRQKHEYDEDYICIVCNYHHTDHKYEIQSVVAPTCTKGGYTLNVCSVCGQEIHTNETNPRGHDAIPHQGQAATCTASGWDAYETCSRCDYTTYHEIPASGHDKIPHAAQSPTCTEIGWEAYETCSRCDYTTYKEIPASGHDWNFSAKNFEGHAAECNTCHDKVNTAHDWEDNECTFCAYTVAGSKGMEYELSEDETYYSLVGIGRCADTDIVIPETYNGLPVKEIGYKYDGVFKGSNITSIVIPDNVEYIQGRMCYNCTSLRSVTIGKGVKRLGHFTLNDSGSVSGHRSQNFWGCTALTEINYNAIACEHTDASNFANAGAEGSGITVKIGAEVKKLPANLFYGRYEETDGEGVDHDYRTRITSVVFANNSVCTEIGNAAFANNIYLSAIELPANVKKIGNSVFEGCALETVVLSEKLETVGERAFFNCTTVQEIDLPDTLTEIGREAFSHTSITELALPEGLQTIGAYAFRDCRGLASVTTKNGTKKENYCELPNGFITLGDNAFMNCNLFTEIVLPNSLINLNAAFEGCTAIERATLPAHAISYIPRGSLQTVVITGGDEIPDSAFGFCRNLESVTIPNSVKKIGESAFYGCNSLKAINIDEIATWCNMEIKTSGSISDSPLTYAQGLYVKGELLTDLVIPEGTAKISAMAFAGYTPLKSVTIPNSVTQIGDYAFFECTGIISCKASVSNLKAIPKNKLETVTVTGGGAIEENSFYDYSGSLPLKTVVLEDGVTEIGKSAFHFCASLTSVTIANSVTKIDGYAFMRCDALEEVSMSENIRFIGYEAFYGCKESIYRLSENGKYLGNEQNPYVALMGAVSDEVTTFQIHANTRYIHTEAFADCLLTALSIPAHVAVIGEHAFSAAALESITVAEGNPRYHAKNNCLIETASNTLVLGCYNSNIPSDGSVNVIGSYAFHNCKTLEEIALPDSLTEIADSAFSRCEALKSITIPDGVTKIGSSAFAYCTALSRVTVPNSVVQIGDSAFSNCKALKSISLPEGIAEIAYGLFEGSRLTQITIPSSVKKIGSNAFAECGSFDEMILPNGVTTIGSNAFHNCSIQTLKLPESVTAIGSSAFSSLYKVEITSIEAWCNISFGNGNANPFRAFNTVSEDEKDQWGLFLNGVKINDFVIPEGVTEIKDYAFFSARIKSITIPDSVTRIGTEAFREAYMLETVSGAKGVTEIAARAFYWCENLQSFSLGQAVTKIGNNAFFACERLNNVIIPKSLTTLDDGAFSSCYSFTELTLPATVTTIGEGAFSGCVALTIYCESASKGEGWHEYWSSKWDEGKISVVWDYRNNDLDENGFAYVMQDGVRYALKDGIAMVVIQPRNISGGITIASAIVYHDQTYSVKSIENNAFYDTSITEITIPESVTKIGSRAFWDCDSLESVVMANSVTEIEREAFMSSGLKRITFSSRVTKIEARLFESTEITSFIVPDGVTELGDSAFYGCRSLQTVVLPSSLTLIGYCTFIEDYASSPLSVFYKGTAEQWKSITIGENNQRITEERLYFYSESEPQAAGNYWHFAADGITPVIWA